MQGPNNGQLVVRVLGSGFPLNDELRIEGGGGRIVPNEAVQVLIDQAMDSGGVTSAIQGYDKDVLILSENALEVREIYRALHIPGNFAEKRNDIEFFNWSYPADPPLPDSTSHPKHVLTRLLSGDTSDFDLP